MAEKNVVTYDDIVRRWKERNVDSVGKMDTLLSNYRILFAYHSNKIESVGMDLHQTREIFENGRVINYTGDTRALFETSNQKTCFENLKSRIINKEEVSPELIKSIHADLLHGCYDEARWNEGERPGEYKKNYYGVGENAGVLPEEVEKEISFICDEVRTCGTGENEVLTAAAYLHCNFENIHPFADGNGRVGRTLMNYYLMLHDLPPAVIYEEDKETYYLALAVFDKAEKPDGFVEYLKEETVKTWTAEPLSHTGEKRKIIKM